MEIDSKKVLLEVAVVVMLFIIIGLFVVKFNKKIIPSIRNYTAYLRSGETIKLDFYIDCYSDKCESPKVSSYTVLNKKVRSLFKDSDLLVQNELYNVIEKAVGVLAKENITKENIEVYSDYKDISSYINRKTQEGNIFSKYINRDNLSDLDFESLNYKNLYVVKFETLSDEVIDDILVEEGETITKQKLKNKDGYKFVSWLFNDKEFDFDTKIFKSITLVANWEKVSDDIDAIIDLESSNLQGEIINLNDSVSYSINEDKYYNVKEECLNKTTKDLKNMFLSNSEEIDELSQNGTIDSSIYRGYLSVCKNEVSEAYIDLVNNTRAMRVKTVNKNEIVTLGLVINDERYSNFSYPKDSIKCETCDLIEEVKTDTVGTLSEDVCSIYNLRCSRW